MYMYIHICMQVESLINSVFSALLPVWSSQAGGSPMLFLLVSFFFSWRELSTSAMDRSMTESFLLDTSVASLILNGELWERSPATLMGSKPDIYAAWRLGDEDLSKTPRHHLELEKSTKAFAWAVKRRENGSPPIYLSPTVQEELQKTKQVTI